MRTSQTRPPILFDATPARVTFKRIAGDTSRYLNTLWVGITTLQAGHVDRPNWWVLGWSMPQTIGEWQDTNAFIAKSGMATVLDGIDQYMKVLKRISGLTNPASELYLTGAARKSTGARFTIPERFAAVNLAHGGPASPEFVAAIDLLATWRNHFVHGDRRFPLDKQSRTVLLSADARFKSSLGGTDIRAILARFDSGAGPLPNDLIALISAAQLAVAALDQHLLFNASMQEYSVALTAFLLDESTDPAALLDRLFRYGGKRSSGSVFALMMKSKVARARGSAPCVNQVSRSEFDAVLAMGRNKASEIFGIARQ